MKDLWVVAERTEDPGNEVIPVARAELQKKLQKVCSVIVLAINTFRLYLVTCEQPRQAWEVLCNHLKCHMLANKLFLKHYI